MTVFLSKQSFLLFCLLFTLSIIINSYVFGQLSKQQKIAELFGNGTNLLNDAFRKVKDSVVQITTEYKGSTSSSNPLLGLGNTNSMPTKYGSDLYMINWDIL